MCRIASIEKWWMWRRCLYLLSWQPCYRQRQVPPPAHTLKHTHLQSHIRAGDTNIPLSVNDCKWIEIMYIGQFFFEDMKLQHCVCVAVSVCVCVCVFTGGAELHSDCLAVVQAPTVQVDPQLTLPLDINNYLMTHYIRAIFRVNTHSHTHTQTQLYQCSMSTWILSYPGLTSPEQGQCCCSDQCKPPLC